MVYITVYKRKLYFNMKLTEAVDFFVF